MIPEYALEDGKKVNQLKLEAAFLPDEMYETAHQTFAIPCHDVIVEVEKDGIPGALLIVRDNLPAKGELWPLGGRILRGYSEVDSLKKRVKRESNLDLSEIIYLGMGRTYWDTHPEKMSHKRGTDSRNSMYYAKGNGEIKLDNLHIEPTIIFPDKYILEYREKIHPYARNIMDKAIPLIGNPERRKKASEVLESIHNPKNSEEWLNALGIN